MAGSPELVAEYGRVDDLLQRFDTRGTDEAIVERHVPHSYADLRERVRAWTASLAVQGIAPGQVVAIQSDFSVSAVSLLLALLANRNVAALLPPSAGAAQTARLLDDAGAEAFFDIRRGGLELAGRFARSVRHPLLAALAQDGRAGVIICTSGSSGPAKVILHDADRFLSKFAGARKRYRALAFLLLDHVAGLDTLFYTLFSGGALVLTDRRDPAHVCQLVARHRVEMLAVTPTFLNLLYLSRAFERSDMSSLKVVAYSSEPMSPHTLDRTRQIFPGIELVQKYGASEFGSPRTKSNPGDSRWLKLVDGGLEHRVVDNILYLKSPSTMLGYLNAHAPSVPPDGWFCTGDEVEVQGDWMRIVGRQTDTIIVGGEKVFPAEVEAVLTEIDGIEDAIVRGEPHPVTGQIVTASVTLQSGHRESASSLTARVREYCRGRLQPHKIPMKVRVATAPIAGSRFKKVRA